jgi:hypothetical protein
LKAWVYSSAGENPLRRLEKKNQLGQQEKYHHSTYGIGEVEITVLFLGVGFFALLMGFFFATTFFPFVATRFFFGLVFDTAFFFTAVFLGAAFFAVDLEVGFFAAVGNARRWLVSNARRACSWVRERK